MSLLRYCALYSTLEDSLPSEVMQRGHLSTFLPHHQLPALWFLPPTSQMICFRFFADVLALNPGMIARHSNLHCAEDCILVCRGWRIAYNSLLNMYAKSGRADLAEGVYQGMLLQGPLPNKNTVNSTIAAFATVRGSYIV